MLDVTGFARSASGVNMNFESYLDMVELEVGKRIEIFWKVTLPPILSVNLRVRIARFVTVKRGSRES